MVILLSPANSQSEFAPNSQYCEFQAEFAANSCCERIRSEFGELKLNSLRICIPTVPSPRSYRRSGEEWGSNAATTQYHTRDALCSSASEAAGLLLEDCAAGALGRAAA